MLTQKKRLLFICIMLFAGLGVAGFLIGASMFKAPGETTSNITQAAQEKIQPQNSVEMKAIPEEASFPAYAQTLDVVTASTGPLTTYHTLGTVSLHKKTSASLSAPASKISSIQEGDQLYLFLPDGALSPLKAGIQNLKIKNDTAKFNVVLQDTDVDPALTQLKFTVRIADEEYKRLRRIPRSAVMRDENQAAFIWTVWEDQAGTYMAVQQPVTVTLENDQGSGLTESDISMDTIILQAPPRDLQHGQALEDIQLSNVNFENQILEQRFINAQADHQYAVFQKQEEARHIAQGTADCFLAVNREGIPFKQIEGGGESPETPEAATSACSANIDCAAAQGTVQGTTHTTPCQSGCAAQ